MGKKGRSINDNRSDAMNPHNPAYKVLVDNLSNQFNPNNLEYMDGDDKE